MNFKTLFERKYWGTEASGALIYSMQSKKLLFIKRSPDEDSEQGQWEFTIGGKKDEEDLDASQNVDREIFEEIGPLEEVLSSEILEIFFDAGEDNRPFKYYTFLKIVRKDFAPQLSEEHTDFMWVDIFKDELPYPLHFGVERLLPKIKTILKDDGNRL